MGLRFIVLSLVVLTIGWKTCVEADRKNGYYVEANQIGWRYNVTGYSSPQSRNNNTRTDNRSHNSTSTTSTRRTSVPNRNTTRITAPNRNTSQPIRNNTQLNHGHYNNTRVTLPNRGSTTPSRNSTHINHGHSNSTIGRTNSTTINKKTTPPPNRSSPPPTRRVTQTNTNVNRGSAPANRNNTTPINSRKTSPTSTTPNQNPPAVIIYVPNTSIKKKKKEPGFTETFLDVIQKELSKATTDTTTPKPRTRAKPITKTKQQVDRRPPSTTKAPIPTTPPSPYPPTLLAPFPITSSPVQNQVLYLPGGSFGYYVCNSPVQQVGQFMYPYPNSNYGNGTNPNGLPFPHSHNGATGSYVPPGSPATQQGPRNFQPNSFYNPQSQQQGTQQDFSQPGAVPQGTSSSVPQGFVNSQPGNPGYYGQPGGVATSQGPGYIQYPATNYSQNIGNGQAGAYTSYFGYPQGFSQPGALPQNLPVSYMQNNQTYQGFSNGQPGSPVSYVANQQGFAQQVYPGSYVQHDQSRSAGLQYQTGNYSSNFQAAPPPPTYPQGFMPGQPGTPVSYPHAGPVVATQQGYANGLPIAPGTPQPYVYGPQGQICTFVYNQHGVAGIVPGVSQQPYPAYAPQVVPNTQPGSYGNSFNITGQYQSYPVWPNTAYPNVHPTTFNMSQVMG